LGGAPLVVRVWERVRSLHLADRVVVATESLEVLDVLSVHGAEGVLTSDLHPSGTDRVAEVAGLPAFADFDIVVNVQGDEPFMRGDAMAGAIAMVRDRGFDLGTAAGRRGPDILGDANCVKVVRADDGRALYFSRAPIPFLRDEHDRADRDAIILQHMGIYAARREALMRWVSLPPHPLELIEKLEQLRALAAGLVMGVAIVDAPSWGEVNTEEDLVRANAHWELITAGTT
jgi:3-deoxy-manno-octulosonate cytidylyltransferase (CMP-KDO synthetase)